MRTLTGKRGPGQANQSSDSDQLGQPECCRAAWLKQTSDHDDASELSRLVGIVTQADLELEPDSPLRTRTTATSTDD